MSTFLRALVVACWGLAAGALTTLVASHYGWPALPMGLGLAALGVLLISQVRA